MKKLIYTLLTLSILFTIGCDDDKKEESVDLIIGTWTLSAVCGFEDENCSGICNYKPLQKKCWIKPVINLPNN